MNNPIIPKLETQQKYPLFYAEATKTINDVIEHITKERGVYSSNIEPDPKEHNIWFNTNDNKLYHWVEEEQSWKTISGGSEIIYFTQFKGAFYNGKTYIFDGNKYDSNISRVSPIEPITNFEAILINCDFISAEHDEYGFDLNFKYISGETNTTKGIYYVKYIDGYCIITKLTDNIVIHALSTLEFLIIDDSRINSVECNIIENNNYVEIVNSKELNEVERPGISVSFATMLEIPQDITFTPFNNFDINELILYGDIDLTYLNIMKFEGNINTLICYNENVELFIDPDSIYIDTIITDHPIQVNCHTVQTNSYDNPPIGNINTMILCNTEDNYYTIEGSYNENNGFDIIPTYVLYGKFNIEFSLVDYMSYFHIVFTEIPQYIKINNFADYTGDLVIYCENKNKEQIKKLITDINLPKNINVQYVELYIYDRGNIIELSDDNELEITINKNYIK